MSLAMSLIQMRRSLSVQYTEEGSSSRERTCSIASAWVIATLEAGPLVGALDRVATAAAHDADDDLAAAVHRGRDHDGGGDRNARRVVGRSDRGGAVLAEVGDVRPVSVGH